MGFVSVCREGIVDLRLIIMLLARMSWADVVMLARGVMYDIRHQAAERDLVARGIGPWIS